MIKVHKSDCIINIMLFLYDYIGKIYKIYRYNAKNIAKLAIITYIADKGKKIWWKL